MRRLITAPNLALATLWADMLTQAGFGANVQRAYASSIAGEVPPDQSLPEVWVVEDAQLEPARSLLAQLRHPPHRLWVCQACLERIDGPFEQCWNCGAAMPP
jgi:Putative prokaryotic signal transducing protein